MSHAGTAQGDRSPALGLWHAVCCPPVRVSLPTMTPATPSPSGLDAVDRQWGGLAAGRAYLLVGRAGAGRSALALQTVRAAVEDGARCLVISPRSPDELVGVGREVGLDLAREHSAGRLRLLRIPKAAELAARGPEGLAKSYRDLVGLVTKDKPSRVVVEDFTPLVQFDTFERFHEAFAGLVRSLREQGATLVIGLGDPANDASRRLLEVVEGLVDGTIRLGAGGDLVLNTPTRPEYPSNDGASVDAEPPPPPPVEEEAAPIPQTADPSGFITTFAPGTPAPTPFGAPLADAAPTAAPEPVSVEAPDPTSVEPSMDATPTPPPEPPGASGPGGPPTTEVVPPPAPDPSLLAPPEDPFGRQDPADSLFTQGYLADSKGGQVLGQIPVQPGTNAGPSLPAFAPLAGGLAPDPGVAFRAALDAAFASRPAGIPFVVIALRMDPAHPDAAHFGAVEAGLRSSLRPSDKILVDAPRKRAAVVLPSSGPEIAQTLFAGLQEHLRSAVGSEADRVLQSVAAVTIPDGQPFQASADLLAYAFEG